MVRLFIENNEIELTSDVQFAITKQLEDITNPTTIINSWSKTVSIPFTQHNNKVFGYIFNIDKVVVDGVLNTGIYFNPYNKIDFRLQWGDDVIMQGYTKMNEVKQIDGKGTYDITLFGTLGKVFQELKNITFDLSTEDEKYIIDGSKYVDETINMDLVAESWNSSGQTIEEIVERGWYSIDTETGEETFTPNPLYRFTDIIGFAPNNAFTDGFDYETFQHSENDGRSTSSLFTDLLEGGSFADVTGINPASLLPDGTMPREIGEYRSYMQLPFIYWNKLWKIFQAKAEALTGYKFNMDSEWFNTSNPYWYNLVYMLKNFEIDKSISNPVYDVEINDGGDTTTKQQYDLYIDDTITYSYTPLLSTVNTIPYSLTNSNTIYDAENDIYTLTDKTGIKFKGDIITTFHIESPDGALSPDYAEFMWSDTGKALIYDFVFYDDNGVEMTSYKLALAPTGCTLDLSDCVTVTDVPSTMNFMRSDEVDFYMPYNIILQDGEIGDKFRIKLKRYFRTDSPSYTVADAMPFTFTVYGDVETAGTLDVDWWTVNTSLSEVVISGERVYRSNSNLKLNQLWNNDYNIFDEIIKYCKTYRIYITVDDINKTINFRPTDKYFKDYTVTDWTNKIDTNRDYIVTPMTFEDKYVLFNYEDNDIKLNEDYRGSYGYNFGEYRLTTDYNFNTETHNLFEGIKSPMTFTPNVLSWENLYDNKIVYSFPAEIYVNNQGEDRKQVDLFGTFFFHCGLSEFDTQEDLNMRPVFISDDTRLQTSTNQFFYTQHDTSPMVRVTTYPHLDVIYNGNMCTFNVPKVNYTYTNEYDNAKSIYTNFWQKYLDERYNVQNKKITCYVDLSPIDWTNFDFNHLIKIGNQICAVNKIYDYDVTSNQTTKVDLITIQDIEAYTNNNYNLN